MAKSKLTLVVTRHDSRGNAVKVTSQNITRSRGLALLCRMATAEQRDGTVEREMTFHQRGLVDTCLEEGQFESAIDLMDQLRSPHYKPPMYVFPHLLI